MRKITLLTLTTLLSSFISLKAQDDTTSSKGSLTVSGYVDAYYQYNFSNPTHTPGIAWENAGRIFDIKHNEFSLGLAQTKFSYSKGKAEAVIDLTYGPNAVLGNFGNTLGGDIFIKQAYINYSATDKLTLTAGQFGTHVGYELIDAPLNFNYSLSYLFGNGPFYHTGLKAAYAVSDKFGVMAGVFNGWDAMYDFNSKKSFGGQIYVAPVDGWNVYINYIGGDEKNGLSFPTIASVGDSISTPSHLFDLTTTYEVSDKLKLGINAAYGMGKLVPDTTTGKFNDGSWFGAALYVNYAVSDKVGLGLRAEHFSDPDGLRYFAGAGSVTGITLTGDIKLVDNLLFKPEFRIDTAENDVFLDDNGAATESSQMTLGAGIIYSF